ncbi:hypothetical protein [Spirabiliibacterium pneumoniae]|nr:hypothetical protein [Spirabiliibacterium pneumoniae]
MQDIMSPIDTPTRLFEVATQVVANMAGGDGCFFKWHLRCCY